MEKESSKNCNPKENQISQQREIKKSKNGNYLSLSSQKWWCHVN